MMMAHDQLSINQDVCAEDKGSSASVDKLAGGAVGKEGGHESKDDEAPERAEEVRHPRGEVILGLAGERRQEDEDSGSQDNGVEDDGGLIEGDNDGDGVGFGEGEEREEEQVCRIGLALPVGQAHEDHGSDQLSMC